MKTRTLLELADLCGAIVDGDGSVIVEGPASLLDAGPREISFLANPRYRPQLASTRAAAVVVDLTIERSRPEVAFLRSKDPNRAFTAIIGAFAPRDPEPVHGVHASAVVDSTAIIESGASIGALCVIGAGARIARGAVLMNSVSIGAEVVIGSDTVVHPLASLYARVRIGARCIIHSGAVIGSDGYGFEPTREGWDKIPQCGIVIIEDDVEIGANVTIDRARFGATRIGRGAKIDNLVQIGHNVVIGEGSLVIAQVGLAGSSKVGRRVIIAGQVGVNGHVEIGDGARIGGQAGVFADVPAGADYVGWPARPRGETMRLLALQNKLPELTARVRALERKLSETEGNDP